MNSYDIPLKFRNAPAWDVLQESPSLHYQGEPYAPQGSMRRQPVLAGRTVLRPDIDFNDYRCNAVIDWIELRLDTPGTHQARNMQPRIDKWLQALGSRSTAYVSGPDRERGHMGNQFILKIQQPLPWELAPLLKQVVACYCPELHSTRDIKIAGIEISVDFRAKPAGGATQDRVNLMRWRMVDILRRHLRPERVLTEAHRCHPRFYSDDDGQGGATFSVDPVLRRPSGPALAEMVRLGVATYHLIPLRLRAHHATPVDTTSYVGARDFPVMLRVMDKTTDQRDPRIGQAAQLAPEEWRARIEVTVTDFQDEYDSLSVLELNRLKDLYGYRFAKVRKPFFDFFLPTFGTVSGAAGLPFPAQVTEQSVFERSGVYGLDRLHRSVLEIDRARFRKKELADKPAALGKKGRLLSYTELNNKVDRALRGLSNDWRDALSPPARSLKEGGFLSSVR